MPLNPPRSTLYLITQGATTERTTRHSPEFQAVLAQVTAAVAAGIDLIQIREKNLSARVLFELTERVMALVQDTQVKVLINDRADIAIGARAEGVHLRADSLDAGLVRKTFGPGLLIGVSTHSADEVRTARDAGADFVVFGPVFETYSKQSYGPPVGLEELARVTGTWTDFPVIALGGVSVDNARDCLRAGAAGIAGIGMFSDPGGLAAVTAKIRSRQDE